MEWLIMPSNNLRMTASKMGFMKDGQYVIGDECQASLEELLRNLQEEDTVSRSSRREIANSKLVEGDLFPILKAAVNDLTITPLVIKVLSNLTLPMAVIMPVKHHMTPQDWEKRRGVHHMESAIKTICTDAEITTLLVSHIKNCIEDAGDYAMDKDSLGMVLEILSLLRNVLHTDDLRPGVMNGDLIINNLLDAGFDDVVIDLLARGEGSVWVSNLTQVLGLMFRSQKSEELFKLLIKSPTTSKNDSTAESSQSQNKKSSEMEQDKQEKESNNQNSMKLPGINGYEDDSPLSSGQDAQAENNSSDQKSENGSESSENSKSENVSMASEGSSMSRLCVSLQGVTRVNSSSSGDSSRSATPTNEMNDNSSTSSCSMDSGSSYTSTIDGEMAARELRKKLSRFALKFAKNGLDRCILVCQMDLLKGLEDMCFLWMQNFFLVFASHPSVTYTDIRHTVSSAVLSNLTYLACQTWQDFKMSMENNRMKGHSNGKFKKLYLVMAVLRQILSQLRRYSEETLTGEEEKWFIAATETLCCTTNLRLLYPMLIRQFQPKNETLQYLRELVHGNGELLHLFSNVCDKHMKNGRDVMLKHFRNFVDSEVVTSYTHLLSHFAQNTLEENEAVFTFYYHVAIDLDAVHMLFHIPVFTNFANIWDTQNPYISENSDDIDIWDTRNTPIAITQESMELIDYIVYKYTEMAMEKPDDGLDIAKEVEVERKIRKGRKRKHEETEEEVPSKVQALNMIILSQTDIKGVYCLGSSTESSDDEASSVSSKEEVLDLLDTAQECMENLRARGYGPQLETLQTLLLEITYVKLSCPKTYPAEPIVWQYCVDRKSIPLFAFTLKDKLVQSLSVFETLLQKMGLHQANDSSHLFPSVPAFMTPEMTYSMAQAIGPIDKSILKFDVSDDMELLPEHLPCNKYTAIEGDDENDRMKQLMRPTHGLRAPGAMWMNMIKRVNHNMPAMIVNK